ncbi:retrovirus-related Pol polyprotein from transposon 412 [Trichonephila clavipes]|nr:retrovirus-related Pol polyprotein from transposon 412 [Trichonephila clavipes]
MLKETIGGKLKQVDHKLRTADRQIGDNHSHCKIFKGNKTFQGTHFRNHKDARNSGKTPELNFDKRKRLQCYECGSFNHLRPQCSNLKTQKVELCRIGVKSEGSLLDPYTSKGKQKSKELAPIIESVKNGNEADYGIKNGILVKKKINKLVIDECLIVVPETLREQIKTICHDETSGHLGVLKTKDRLLRHFFWPKCYKEIEDFVKTCDPCQRVGKTNDRKKALLVTVPVISEVFSKINVDARGPMPISTEGNKYFITVMCLASKYPDAIPVPDITSKSVVNALLLVFSRMGFPRKIQTDQGTSFMSRLTVEFFNRFGIKVSRSSVYHSQSNPVKRFHRTVKRILKVLCIEAAPNWEVQVPAALFALRTVTHESTGFSPAELVYGNSL